MGIVRNGKKVGGLVIGGKKVGGLVIGGKKVFRSGNRVTVTIPNSDRTVDSARIDWSPRPTLDLGASLSSDTMNRYLSFLRVTRATGGIQLHLGGTPTDTTATPGHDFSDDMEMNGSVTLAASDSSSVTVMFGSDTIEPYEWTPSNAAAVISWASAAAGLSDGSLTVTFNDNP